MTPLTSTSPSIEDLVQSAVHIAQPNWVANANVLWARRRFLVRAGGIALFLSAIVAFTIPKTYESTARLMPPEQGGGSAAMFAALASRSLGGLGGLGSLAGSLFGGHTSSSLFIDLLHSRSVNDRIIERFDLQKVYSKRYRVDTVKYMARHLTTVDDKKSGVITITYSDTDAVRARAITQAYLDELNKIVTTSNTSSARREREFIEKRLVSAKTDLESAEKALGAFSSVNTTLDIKEQTHAMVDAGAKLQAELIVGQSELNSLEQIYGPENIRVRAAKARIGNLQHELNKMSGSSAALPEVAPGDDGKPNESASLYPSIRQLPRLAVPYANLYRTVKIQETVFELLSQQYELARVEEAKDTPVVSVIDAPLVAEKKSFPPRILVMLGLTLLSFLGLCFAQLTLQRWEKVSEDDPRKRLAREVTHALHATASSIRSSVR